LDSMSENHDWSYVLEKRGNKSYFYEAHVTNGKTAKRDV
jgi:hypothetical protein